MIFEVLFRYTKEFTFIVLKAEIKTRALFNMTLIKAMFV